MLCTFPYRQMIPYHEEHFLEVQICIELSLIAADRVLQANLGRVILEDRRKICESHASGQIRLDIILHCRLSDASEVKLQDSRLFKSRKLGDCLGVRG
jgi:hypothetical protein